MDESTPVAAETFAARDVVNFFHRLENEIAGNAVYDYLFAAGIAVFLLALVLYLRGFLRHRLTAWLGERSRNTDAMLAGKAVSALFELLLIIPFYAAFRSLQFSSEFTGAIGLVFLLLFTWRGIIFFSRFSVAVLDSMLSRNASYMGARAVAPIITFVVWAIGIIFVLDNLGVKISSIVAGLGIVGVAVGLASQAMLGDFFGYLAILMDRPFKIGDAVTSLNGSSGIIEKVGLKTTKIRLATGELMLLPNGDLSKSALINNSMTESRGRAFRFGVTYETPLDKVKAIPDMVKLIVADATANVSLTRVHFIEFADSSLLFEVQFMVPGNSNIDVLDAQHAINLALMERFAAEGIEFAYPTSTLYVGNELRLSKSGR